MPLNYSKGLSRARSTISPSIYSKKVNSVEITDFSGGLNTKDEDISINDNQLSYGQNLTITGKGKLEKALGMTLYGNFLGTTTGILWGGNFVNRTGTQEQLVAYDTGLYRYVASVWTALTGVTLTTNKDGDGAYFPLTNKFYYINQTDNVVKYTSGTSADQTDANFKKGKFVEHFQNRLLVANVSSQEDYVWYTDLGVDTFSANNYFRVEGTITGLKTFYDKVLIFTKRKIHRLQNFIFDGNIAGPEAVFTLPTEFGTIYDRTIVVADNLVYFVGQDLKNKCHIYVTDGFNVSVISDNISPTLDGLAAGQLQYACAGFDGRYYRVAVAQSGYTTNNLEIKFNVIEKRLEPFGVRGAVSSTGIACYWSSETSGQWDLYVGTQSMGQVYKLDQENYDELPEESYTTLGTLDRPIDANPAKRGAQSFKLSNYNSVESINISAAYLRLKKVSGTTTDLTVRIETDNNGEPSGTLADTDATSTVSAFTGTSYSWIKAVFSNVTLSGNTTYWLVVKHVTEGTGNSKYAWAGDACSPTYINGNSSMYQVVTTAATVTFNPDADPESTSVDGAVYRILRDGIGEDFSTIRSGAGTNVYSGGLPDYPFAGTYLSSFCTSPNFDSMDRAILLFDTSSLPDDASISAATLSLYVADKNDDYAQDVGITSSNPASNTAIVASDYAIANFGSTDFATRVSISDINLNAYNNWTLNASGIAAISKTGITKFAVRLSGDIDNSAPTYSAGAESHIFFHQSDRTTTQKPRLIVTYTSVTGSSVWQKDTSIDQNFVLYSQSAIDAYADTKAYMLGGMGNFIKLQRFMSLFSTVGSYNIEIGFNNGETNNFINYLVDLSGSGSAVWGSFSWADGTVWGGNVAKNYSWENVSSIRGRSLKTRIRNRLANQPFTFNGIKFVFNIIRKNR